MKKRKAGDVVFAAMTIQRAFKKYKQRKLKRQIEEGLPDLNAKDVQEATIKIQSSFRGFQARKKVEKKKRRAGEVVFAAMTIQRAFKRYKAKKQKQAENDLPDLNDSEVKDAAIKIQSAYRGFQTRRVVKKKVVTSSSDSSESEEEYDKKRRVSSDSSETESEDEIKKPPRPSVMRRPPKAKPLKTKRIPDSSATESATATDTDVDEGRNRRQKVTQRKRVPDSSATESQSEQGESLPDLDDSDVEDAALKIQSAFRGFQARKNVDTIKKGQKMGDVLHSAMVIQRSFRRYKKKKQERKKAAILLQQEKLAKESRRISAKVNPHLLFYPFTNSNQSTKYSVSFGCFFYLKSFYLRYLNHQDLKWPKLLIQPLLFKKPSEFIRKRNWKED